MKSPAPAQPTQNYSDRHLRFGWWTLLVWLTLGIALEALHGFKIGWLLDVGNESRRLMFRLAHTHGTLLALINIAVALTARIVSGFVVVPAVSFSLIWASVLMPLGFFLGGIVTHGGDPSLGVWLVPVGALLLLFAVARIARGISK